MPDPGVATRRLASLGVEPAAGGGAAGVAEVVRHHLAMQGQDVASVLWSVGLRTGATAEQVREAVEARLVTRSWPMRGTLHLMATQDVRWMCRLLNPRLDTAMARRFAELGLTDEVVGTARRVVVSALERVPVLTRSDLLKALQDNGIDPSGQRGYHLLGRFCQEGLLCMGPGGGREGTFVLLEQWVPHSWDPSREEAMAMLAQRYVRSHGPVSEKDFAGWCGQTLAFVREAVALAGDSVGAERGSRAGSTPYLVHVDEPAPPPRPSVHLLPGFDEYLLGYKDRSAMLTKTDEALVVPGGNGVFRGTVVAGGVVVGTWSRAVSARTVRLTVTPMRAPSATRKRAVERAAQRYATHLGLLGAEVVWQPVA